jgi:very-short-patch-repair endonuclease
VQIQCAWCDNAFYAPRHRAKTARFCTPKCRDDWRGRNKTSHACKVCGGTFKWSPSRQKTYNIKYCSLDCRDKDPEVIARLLAMNRKQQMGLTTKIESIGYALLDDLGVEYLPQHLFAGKFTLDAYLPEHGISVQFDGDYWHGHPDKYPEPDNRQRKRMQLDKSQDAYLLKCGVRVFRAWGSDLRGNLEHVRSQLQRLLDAPKPSLSLRP